MNNLFEDEGNPQETYGFNAPFHTAAFANSQSIVETEIKLGPDMLSTLNRRGRRRFRDIQMNCQAMVRLDRARGVLHVCGSEASIHAVRAQLASLRGPRKVVPPAVWAELMRTRTLQESPHASVARLQRDSGCRIHIERSRQEVRLFGPDESILIADQLLNELAMQCSEASVQIGAHALSSETLHTLANSYGVTLHVDEGQIVILGLTRAVSAATAELKQKLAHLPSHSSERSDPEKGAAVKSNNLTADLAAEKSSIQDQHYSVTDEGAAAPLPSAQLGMAQPSLWRQAVVTPADAAHQNKQGQASFDLRKVNPPGQCCNPCPTCGAGQFCTFCGATVQRVAVSFNAQHIVRAPHTTTGPAVATTAAAAVVAKDGGVFPSTGQRLEPENVPAQWAQQIQLMRYSNNMPGVASASMVACPVPANMVPVYMMPGRCNSDFCAAQSSYTLPDTACGS